MNKVCKEHEWVEHKFYNNQFVFACKNCHKIKPPIDFHISENISVINKQEWEDKYDKQNKGKVFYGKFFDWVKENYEAPKKKNV